MCLKIYEKSALVFVSLVLSVVVAADIECVIPFNDTGRCIPSVQCSDYERLLYKVPLTTEIVNFLRQVQCGYEGDLPNVCCPNSGTYRNISQSVDEIKVRPSKSTESPTTPPPIPLGNRYGASGGLLPSRGECGKQGSGDRIFDGEVTGIDEFPWMALLEYGKKRSNGNGFACGGVLINNRYVLTAAHCVSGADYMRLGGLVNVRLGEYNIDTKEDCVEEYGFWDCALPPVDVIPEDIVIHPEYVETSSDKHHDIALVRLSKPIKYTDFVKPICLPGPSFNKISTNPGQPLFVAGWGKTETGFSPVKLKLKVPLVGLEDCARIYRQFNVEVERKQLCAGGEFGRATCRGDSGGPLMGYDKSSGSWYSMGVVSIGLNQCGKSGVPGVYIKVQDYIKWIIKNIKP